MTTRKDKAKALATGHVDGRTWAVGIKAFEVTRDILEPFYAYENEDARAAFANSALVTLSKRLNQTWPVVYELLRIVRDRELYRNAEWIGSPSEKPRSYASFEEYLQDRLSLSWHTFAELETTYHYAETCEPRLRVLGYEEAVAAAAKARTIQAADAEDTGIVRPEGRPNKLAKFASLSQMERAERNGISHYSQKKLDRLARDFPEQHERVRRGEVSVHRACIEAGFIKESTPLENLHRAWKKADADARAAFVAWLEKAQANAPDDLTPEELEQEVTLAMQESRYT